MTDLSLACATRVLINPLPLVLPTTKPTRGQRSLTEANTKFHKLFLNERSG